MKRKSTLQVYSLLSIAIFQAACGLSQSEPSNTEAPVAPTTPTVNDKSQNLLLSWFEDGAPKTAFSPTEVPDEYRSNVRVQDLELPPEKRDTTWVFLADLTRPNAEGQYPVKAQPRDKWERERHKPEPAPVSPAASQPALTAPSNAPVIMYATKHCPACKKARRWLLKNKIPYIEKDLEADAQAAATVAKKGQAQGVPTSGVPIFEIRGKLVPGFDPGTIIQLLSGPRAKDGPRKI